MIDKNIANHTGFSNLRCPQCWPNHLETSKVSIFRPFQSIDMTVPKHAHFGGLVRVFGCSFCNNWSLAKRPGKLSVTVRASLHLYGVGAAEKERKWEGFGPKQDFCKKRRTIVPDPHWFSGSVLSLSLFLSLTLSPSLSWK